jgi:hypothetical protein
MQEETLAVIQRSTVLRSLVIHKRTKSIFFLLYEPANNKGEY